ncbi:MAG: hypothetical protein K8T10_05885 [Candidatus Eremiobacteraeota bacterium]|nr:hypothetical protein [Candidatus Eremiobacteraeota bacterium]
MIDRTPVSGIKITTGNIQAPGKIERKKGSEESTEAIIDRADLTAQDLRKASIEYFPIHVKRRREARDKAKAEGLESQKSIDSQKKESSSLPTKPEDRAPDYIADVEDKTPSISEVINDNVKIDAGLSKKSEGYDITPFEKKLSADLGPLVRVQNDWDIDGLQGRIPGVSEMKEIFGNVASDESIPFEYLPDGCYARAHIASKYFLDKGINCAKLYVMLSDTNMDDPFYPFPPFRLEAKNKFTEGRWWYHVAPVTFAKDEETGKVEGYVIDPAVNPEKPLKASDWVRGFWDGTFPIQFDTTQADISNPPVEDFMNYQPKEFSQEKFDKFTPMAKKMNASYKRVLDRIKKEYYEDHPENIERKTEAG